MTINIVNRTDDLVKVRHVLVSVSDKSGLETFIPALLEINPEIRFSQPAARLPALERSWAMRREII